MHNVERIKKEDLESKTISKILYMFSINGMLCNASLDRYYNIDFRLVAHKKCTSYLVIYIKRKFKVVKLKHLFKQYATCKKVTEKHYSNMQKRWQKILVFGCSQSQTTFITKQILKNKKKSKMVVLKLKIVIGVMIHPILITICSEFHQS